MRYNRSMDLLWGFASESHAFGNLFCLVVYFLLRIVFWAIASVFDNIDYETGCCSEVAVTTAIHWNSF
jgi:hypothetical protein